MEEAIKDLYEAVNKLREYEKELNRSKNSRLKVNLVATLSLMETFCAEEVRDLCREHLSKYEKNKENILRWRKKNIQKFNEYQRNYQRKKASKLREMEKNGVTLAEQLEINRELQKN